MSVSRRVSRSTRTTLNSVRTAAFLPLLGGARYTAISLMDWLEGLAVLTHIRSLGNFMVAVSLLDSAGNRIVNASRPVSAARRCWGP